MIHQQQYVKTADQTYPTVLIGAMDTMMKIKDVCDTLKRESLVFN